MNTHLAAMNPESLLEVKILISLLSEPPVKTKKRLRKKKRKRNYSVYIFLFAFLFTNLLFFDLKERSCQFQFQLSQQVWGEAEWLRSK